MPIDEKTVLLEGGQGSNINGNMFVLIKELATNPVFVDYKILFTVTKQTMAKAKERLALYGCHRVVLVERNTKAYLHGLATAKYLFTDNTFPPYFHKRQGQVYCNTWHGTPLKTLGFANKETMRSVGNIQKNFLQADYVLFPNEFTRLVFMKDYALEHIFKGKSILANYPRNQIFYNRQQGEELKEQLGFGGKKLFAYMPTFRDGEKSEQLAKIQEILEQWDACLDDTCHLLVNLHFVLASGVDCSRFRHISYFPETLETYDVLNACDGLITDYSSVFFDYAVTGKPIVLFAYDKEDYLKNRGTYFPLQALPFPLAERVEDVVSYLNDPTPIPPKFLETFCGGGSENSAFELLSQVMLSPCVQEEPEEPKAPLCLVYASGLSKGYYESLQHLIQTYDQHHFVIAYRGKMDESLKEIADLYKGRVTLLGLLNAFQFTLPQRLALFFQKKKFSKNLNEFFTRESSRLFGGITPDMTVDFSGNHAIMAAILNELSGEKFFVKHSGFLSVLSSRKVQLMEKQFGFGELDHTDYEEAWLKKNGSVLQGLVAARSFFKPVLPLYLNMRGKWFAFPFFGL
ncbi:MAG: CDP-glycerol glycerophosphotransferase family protein [Clostridia bacterium]|nr:CDP-glycerol glycerophosphotransferase family protein [Clostridia bacterium]